MTQKSFTGRARERRTPRSVRTAERTARALISAGGIGTILAVILIFVFLVWVVAPLFQGGEVSASEGIAQAGVESDGPWIATGMDELKLMGWVLARDGRIQVLDLRDGTRVLETRLFEGAAPTCWALTPDGGKIALGFADGTVRAGSIGFATSFPDRQELPAELRQLEPGAVARFREGMVQVTPEGQVRLQTLAAKLDPPGRVGDSAIRLLDYSVTSDGNAYGVLTEKGKLALFRETFTENWMTGEVEREISEWALPYTPRREGGAPAHLRISGIANTLYLAWVDGYAERYDVRSKESAQVAETFDLTPEQGVEVTHLGFLLGKTTLLAGDSAGRVGAWFPMRPNEDPGTIDGIRMANAHVLEGPTSPVTAIAASPRTRLCLAGYADGSVRLFHVTSANLVASTSANSEARPVRVLALAPKEDAILAWGDRRPLLWNVDAGYPQANLESLFGKVWYESYPEPQHVWQSSSATDDFEEKFGMMPLIFGTLKATLYSMLIAVPIALLAAVFTSEFLRPSVRPPIKSVIEMMASLPSVVLGFLAALVIAPFVQHVGPAVLAAFLALPVALLLGARLWQLLPTRVALRLAGIPRFAAVAAMLPLGILLAALLGGPLESTLFGGDIKAWLDAPELVKQGVPVEAELLDPVGGWIFLLIPLSATIVFFAFSRSVDPWVRRISMQWSSARCASADFVKLAAGIVLTVLVAWCLGWILGDQAGWDPRGSIVGTYAQRNAMIVGFVMGFAIVPIIYTLAEDALTSVPQALREGSLGAGATPWQTAVRIVIPTATSGLFGALMVGLGRAVGETMIVLMAAGNTPILDWNPFNGFRTLSANIAVELPEAVKDSTHYRTLFLAALVLFAITFVINTFAEFVRRRVRRSFSEQL